MTTELLSGDYGRFLQLIIALNNYEKESGGFKSVRTHATNRRTQKTLGGHIVTRYLKFKLVSPGLKEGVEHLSRGIAS